MLSENDKAELKPNTIDQDPINCTFNNHQEVFTSFN
jgi:hypothetical protein